MKTKKPLNFDEFFKQEIKDYFVSFAKVITDYEIIELPKKVDLLIIEVTQPIEEHVKIFKYFKRFNIIEFKSERNRSRLNQDLYKILIYIGDILLKEKEADEENSTFTLVTSLKPVKFLRKYNATELRQGLYKIENITLIPIHIVVIEELEINFDYELSILKEFTSIKDREKYFIDLLHLSKNKQKKYEKKLDNLSQLYTIELDKIAKKEGIIMNIVEKNFREYAEVSGYKDDMISLGIEKKLIEITLNAYNYKFSIEEIMKITGLPEDRILNIIKNSKK
jgi:hypothetical protein